MKTDIDTDWIIPSSHHRLSVAPQSTVHTAPTMDNYSWARLRSPHDLYWLAWNDQQFQFAVRISTFEIYLEFCFENRRRRKVARARPVQCKKWCGKGSVAPSYIFLMTDSDNEQFFSSRRVWGLRYATTGETLRSSSGRVPSGVSLWQLHMWKITITSWVFYAAIKPRPGPWWNNPMLDNLLVTPVIFIKTGCGSLNWRCWLRAESYGRNISWDAAASCPPFSLSLISRNLRAAANIAICVELTGKGLYCQGWYQCNIRYWYLSVFCIKMKYERLPPLRQVWNMIEQCSAVYSLQYSQSVWCY